MPKIDPPRALNPEQLSEIGEKMRQFAERYLSLAEAMRKNNVSRIPVKNLKTLQRALGYIQKAVNKAQSGYDDALLITGVFADPAQARDFAEGMQALNDSAEKPDKPKKTRSRKKAGE